MPPNPNYATMLIILFFALVVVEVSASGGINTILNEQGFT